MTRLTPSHEALLKLAFEGLERIPPNVDLARGVLREVLGAATEPAPAAATEATSAVTIAQAAKRLGYSAKHVRSLVQRREVPTIGTGRACRVLIEEAIAALRANGKLKPERLTADEVVAAGAEWARRRGALKVIAGG